VFDPEYALMPLEELGDYIRQKRRLPGMLSAEEIAEEGLAVGDMLNKQQVKIEELTLYILQLQEQINVLRRELLSFKRITGAETKID
jgi:hypothetical protein